MNFRTLLAASWHGALIHCITMTCLNSLTLKKKLFIQFDTGTTIDVSNSKCWQFKHHFVLNNGRSTYLMNIILYFIVRAYDRLNC